jgi:peroxiredoxin
MIEQQILSIGDDAPDFALMDQHNSEFRLSELKGKKVLLSFHPLAWTGVCAQQMKALEANKSKFDELNTVAVGLSVDSIPTKHAWAKDLGIKDTRILSDFWPHGQVAKLYGLFRNKQGTSKRANVIIDEDGKVAFVKVYDIPELPDIDEIIEFLKK